MTAYRVGIVGAGNISKLHLDGMKRHPDRFVTVALTDPNETSLQERAKEYGIERTYPELSAMVAEAELDVAIVCTPTHIRSQVIVPLLEAGLPVFCEKPLGEDYAEAKGIEEASLRTGVPVAVNQNFRRHYGFAMAKDEIATGTVGRPLHLSQQCKFLRRDIGWRNDRKRYVMAVMSIHWFDGYRWMFGQEPESVYCCGVNSPLTEGGDDTAVSVTLRFPDGLVASLDESFSSLVGVDRCIIDCERGALELSYDTLRVHTSPEDCREVKNAYDKPEATYFLLDDLMRAKEEGREPGASVSDNLKSMAIMEAAYRSLDEGRVVALKEITK